MPRKTTILIVILAAVTGILIFLAVRNESALNQITTSNTAQTPSPTVMQSYALLGFSTNTLDATNVSTQTVDIVIDTAGKPVAGAQIELSYDPAVFTNVRLLPAAQPFFGKNAAVLINSVDQEQGRISYAVGIAADDTEKVGNGTIVRLSFTASRNASIPSSPISFLSKSAVTTLSSSESVLLHTSPLQVILTPPTVVEN